MEMESAQRSKFKQNFFKKIDLLGTFKTTELYWLIQ